MDQPNCWDLSSLAALAGSMRAEAADLRAVLPHAKGRGRAWMMLSWRAGYLQDAASHIETAVAGCATSYDKRLALRKLSCGDAPDLAAHCWRVEVEQSAGHWHNAFALRQGHIASEEIAAAVRAALAAEVRAETAAKPPAP